MISGEKLSLWRILRSWWNTTHIRAVDLVLNSYSTAGFHLTNVKNRLPHRYRRTFMQLLDMYEEGRIRPRIDSIWTFQQVIRLYIIIKIGNNYTDISFLPISKLYDDRSSYGLLHFMTSEPKN